MATNPAPGPSRAQDNEGAKLDEKVRTLTTGNSELERKITGVEGKLTAARNEFDRQKAVLTDEIENLKVQVREARQQTAAAEAALATDGIFLNKSGFFLQQQENAQELNALRADLARWQGLARSQHSRLQKINPLAWQE